MDVFSIKAFYYLYLSQYQTDLPMKLKIISIVFLFLMANFAQGQVKLRVKKLNADRLTALIPQTECKDKIDVLKLFYNLIFVKDLATHINTAIMAIKSSEK